MTRLKIFQQILVRLDGFLVLLDLIFEMAFEFVLEVLVLLRKILLLLGGALLAYGTTCLADAINGRIFLLDSD